MNISLFGKSMAPAIMLNRIIDIPNFDNDDYLQLTHENLNYLQKMFDTGNILLEKMRSYLVICCNMIKILCIGCECHVAKETGNGSDVT